MSNKIETALSLSASIQGGQVSVLDALSPMINSIEQDSSLFALFDRQSVLDQIQKVQQRLDAGESLPLAGIPVGVGENICTLNEETASGSKMLGGFKPPFEATSVTKLKEAGAIIMGKLRVDEFACDGLGCTAPQAVAQDQVLLAFCTDTAGSLRVPAALAEVCCVRPSYGSVSRSGTVAYVSSMDQICILGNHLGDCSAALEVISGNDPTDSTSCTLPAFTFPKDVVSSLEGTKIGFIREFWEEADGLDDITVWLQSSGAQVETLSLPALKDALEAFIIIGTAEASANMARFDGIKYGYQTPHYDNLFDLYIKSRSEGFNRKTKERLALGSLMLSSDYYHSYYEKAMCVRRMVLDTFVEAFQKMDFLATPVIPTSADWNTQTILGAEQNNRFHHASSLAGLPSIVLPFRDGQSVQIIGKSFEDVALMSTCSLLDDQKRRDS